MRETQRGTVSSNSRFQTVLFQRYSANLSVAWRAGPVRRSRRQESDGERGERERGGGEQREESGEKRAERREQREESREKRAERRGQIRDERRGAGRRKAEQNGGRAGSTLAQVNGVGNLNLIRHIYTYVVSMPII